MSWLLWTVFLWILWCMFLSELLFCLFICPGVGLLDHMVISYEAEAPTLWPPDAKNWPIVKDPGAGKDWKWEEKGTAEDEMVIWHHQLDGHEFEQALGVGDRQRSLMCCSPWGHKESDMTERLNWRLVLPSKKKKSHPLSPLQLHPSHSLFSPSKRALPRGANINYVCPSWPTHSDLDSPPTSPLKWLSWRSTIITMSQKPAERKTPGHL